MTTKKEISDWFDRGVAQAADYMVVVCDTFEYSDYPVFTDAKGCHDCCLDPGDMQRVMEVYDLRRDKTEQLNEARAYHPPGTST